VHLDTIKVYYSPTNAQVIFLKTILKFTSSLLPKSATHTSTRILPIYAATSPLI